MLLKLDYEGGSIVNLISSVSKSLGGKPMYKPLRGLNIKDLTDSKNLVLIVIDGLGYDYLTTTGKGTFLQNNIKQKITSVFPTTTASAITAFRTGLPTQQTGYTGWFVYLKELGVVSKILPFSARFGGESFSKNKVSKSKFFPEPFYNKLKVKTYNITHENIAKADLRNRAYSYKNMAGFFNQIKKVIKIKGRKYISAYWPEFDSIAHSKGLKTSLLKKHLKHIDKKVELLVKSLKGTKTTLLITADHGLMECHNHLNINNYPDIYDCLALPFSGDERSVYCYLKYGRAKEFERLVKTKLKNKCDIYKSEFLVKQNLFGLYKPDKKFLDRIGDYTLIAKKGYNIRDFLVHEKTEFNKGSHSGLSSEELYVPLIVIKT
ncbi:MAG: alkaline phosphatase family protein [Candidatus Omnitrophica bacterium]|nr:alkaline phosphatase family protein [Candidatus Omnitrophota bacterium]